MNASTSQVIQDKSETLKLLWQNLCAEKFAQGELPEFTDASSEKQAWFIRVMLGFAGWVGALFLMGFVGVGISFVMKSALASFLFGSVFCAIAWRILKTTKAQDFLVQFALAISLAGQGIFMIGLNLAFGGAYKSSMISTFLLAFLFELVLIFTISNFIHRFLTTLFSIVAFTLFLNEIYMPGIEVGLCAIGLVVISFSVRTLYFPLFWRPIFYGLACALLCTQGQYVFTHGFYFYRNSAPNWWMQFSALLNFTLIAVAILMAAFQLLKREQVALQSKLSYWVFFCCFLLVLASYFAAGLSVAMLLVMIGFANGNRLIWGMGIIALLSFLSHYYFQMQASLLFKSGVLFSLAVSLILIRFFLLKSFPVQANQEFRQERN